MTACLWRQKWITTHENSLRHPRYRRRAVGEAVPGRHGVGHEEATDVDFDRVDVRKLR